MEVKFNEEYLRDMYHQGKSDKKHRFQPQIIRKYIRVVDLMIAEENVQGQSIATICNITELSNHYK